MKRTLLILALGLAATGCKKKDEPAAPPPTADTPTGSGVATGAIDAGPVAPAIDAAAAEIAVPTPVDFEEDVGATVTDKTLETDLANMEKELAP